MKKMIRGVAAMLTTVMLGGSIPAFSALAATQSPFDSSVISSSNKIIESATVVSSKSIGYNNEVSYYNATIKSLGTRKDKAKTASGNDSRRYAETFKNVSIASGGKLFVYSMSDSGTEFENHLIKDIAAQFEADNPGWKVAVVTNASFFDNEDAKTPEKGEPEDIYIENGKTYKTYIEMGEDGGDVFKVGRGIIGLKDNGEVIYNTIENGTSHYTGSTPYEFAERYTLAVLGESKTNAIYEYSLRADGVYDSTDLGIVTPNMDAKNLTGATVYKIKCSEYRRAHVGVNGREVGDQTYYFEGKIESITTGTTSMNPVEGYVYVTSYAPLEYLQVGATVRCDRNMIGEWSDASYVFGYKQQILHEGSALFNGIHQETYGSALHGDTTWDNTWSEDLSYVSYGSNRTAIGFKEDGTPVIITMPRVIYYDADGTTVKGEASATYSEMAWYMKSLGCVNAFMLDCGGSTGMYTKDTGSDTYTATCWEPKWSYPSRPVSTALILAYPSGVTVETPTDEVIAEPAYGANYVTPATNSAWYDGSTNLRSSVTLNEKFFKLSQNSTYSGNFTLEQSGNTYTFTPTSKNLPSGSEAIYGYTRLGYKVGANKKYTYTFKLMSHYYGGYSSFIFADKTPSGTKKMLNDFHVLGGTFSNLADSAHTYSNVTVGYGRAKTDVSSDVEYTNSNIALYLGDNPNNSEIDAEGYSFYRIDIDGLKYTVKTMNSSGVWVQLGGEYSIASGTELVMGYASWGNLNRVLSVKDAVCVDVTELSSNITKAKALNSSEYTSTSFASLSSALTKADYSTKLTSQDAIDYASTNLSSVMSKLVKRIDVANANIAEFESMDFTRYSAESVAALTAVYQNIVDAKSRGNLEALDALNSEFALLKSSLVPSTVSLSITWQKIDFTYSTGDKQWNPSTHTYDNNGTGSWTSNGNSNVINVKNNSDTDVTLDFKYTPKVGFEGISGEFYSNGSLIGNSGLTLGGGASQDVSLNVKGELPQNTADNTPGASVTITVNRLKGQ